MLWMPFSALGALCEISVAPQIIRDVRVFDGEHVIEHRSVLIEDGKISRVGEATLTAPQAEVIDGQDRTLLPGLIDAHVHLPGRAEEASHQALLLGVTTQLDMFSGGERLKKIKEMEADDRPDLADVRTAGVGATVPGGHPTQMGGGSVPTITSPGQAQAFVDARVAEGSDYIKIIHDDGSTWTWTTKRVPMLNTATLRALVEAGTQARQVSGSSCSLGRCRFRSVARESSRFVIPTLSTLYPDCGRPDGTFILADPRLGTYIRAEWRHSLEMLKPDPALNHFCKGTDEGVQLLIKAHVPLLVGTDSHSGNDFWRFGTR